MRLYNTLSRRVEDLKPLNPPNVSLYTCGPTVYDYMHIGNLRKFVFDDTLRRVLEANAYKVRHVMNITDVGHLVSDGDEGEDKLEKGAKREGKTVWQVADHYIKAFKQDMEAMNVLPPNGYQGQKVNYARATDFIDEQISMVKALLDKDFAYQAEQAIYFDVTKLESYGELTAQKLSEKEVGVRDEVVTDNSKRHPQDFALWFFATGRFSHHDMHWPSPWGEGFPGWHLECSAIIHATLGEPIDIHTGGVDNIGTHHVNEMAQTEAAYGVKLANYWLHSEHLLVDNQRMGKSLGNFYTLKDITEKKYDPMALRLLYHQAHYRSQINFTWESLEAAQARLTNLRAWADLAHQRDVVGQTMAVSAQDCIDKASDDLRTFNVLMLIEANITQVPQPELLDRVEQLLGLQLTNRPDISAEQKQIIAEREKARNSDDWPKADELRQRLAGQGVEINDTPRGPVWSRV